MLSLILGPMEYMDNRQRIFVIKEILEILEVNPPIDPNKVKNSSINFWPNIAKFGRNEPDILITLNHGEVNYVILIEAKWDSPQGADQLKNQWKWVNNKFIGHDFWHIYLTKKPHSLHEMINPSENNHHASRLKSLTWAKLGHALLKAGPRIGSFSEWPSHVQMILNRYGMTPFTGFTPIPESNNLAWRFHKALRLPGNAILQHTDTTNSKGEILWNFDAAKN